MNDQFFEMDETDHEEELLAFDHEGETGDYEQELSGGTHEEREIELAAELLGVSDEQELDEFFGKLLSGARKMLASPLGQKLKGMLRQTARQALPQAGQMIGGYIGGDRGATFGGKVAAAGGQLFGLELEGLSPEDRELQIARRYVRLAGEALRRLSAAPSGGNPARVAETAFLGAARRHAPGLASRISAGGNGVSRSGASRPSTGRWIRKGSKIYVLGL